MGSWATRVAAACALGVVIAASPAARAQSEESARQAARKLGNEGIELYEKGDYASAEDRLERAYRVVQVPTLGLWLARARAQNGKLVEASELYLQVTRMEVDNDAPDVLREAVADAAKEHRELEARIPTLTISLEKGEDTAGIEIVMDGNELRSALLGVPIPVNPGKHKFEVRRGGKQLSGGVELAEAEHKAIELTFGKEDAAPPPAAPADPTPTASAAPPPPAEQGAPPTAPLPLEPDQTRSGNGQRAVAFASLGVGAAGLATGGILGASAIQQRNDLDASGGCIQESCSMLLRQDVDDYNNTRIGSTVGFAVGGVSVAAGVILLVTAPKRGRAHRDVEPWVGLRTAGIRGNF